MAGDAQHNPLSLTRSEGQLEDRRRAVESGRGRLEVEAGGALHSVEPEVAQRHRGIRVALGRNLAAASPAVPTHLEEIGKIAGKLNAEPEVVRPDVEITDGDALV